MLHCILLRFTAPWAYRLVFVVGALPLHPPWWVARRSTHPTSRHYSPLIDDGNHPRCARAAGSLTISTTAGLPAASAFSSAGRTSAGFSTRKPTQPIASATFEKLTDCS